LGVAGKTVSMQVEYLQPAPLLKPLRIELARAATGRRSTTQAWLFEGDDVCTRGTVVAVVADRSKLAPLARREGIA
jgi:hypothetical protein